MTVRCASGCSGPSIRAVAGVRPAVYMFPRRPLIVRFRLCTPSARAKLALPFARPVRPDLDQAFVVPFDVQDLLAREPNVEPVGQILLAAEQRALIPHELVHGRQGLKGRTK